MGRKRYSSYGIDDQINRVIELYKQEYSYDTIAEIVNKEFDTDFWHYEKVRNITRQYRKHLANENAEKVIRSIEDKNHSVELGVVEDKPIANSVLVLSDLHIPYNRSDILDIIEKHKDEINAIIFAGDIIDCKAVSSFPSLDDITIEEEIIASLDFFHKVRDIVGSNVRLILHNGNHEARWARYIANMHQKKLYKFINPNILEMLKDGMTIYNNGKECHYEGVSDLIIVNSWYINYGHKLITAHPFNFTKIPTKNATQAVEHLIDKGEEFQMLICAHNHHQAECSSYLGKYAVEGGCLCQEFDYSNGRTSTRAQDYGYVVVAFDEDNNVDKNRTKVYKLEPEVKETTNVYIEM